MYYHWLFFCVRLSFERVLAVRTLLQLVPLLSVLVSATNETLTFLIVKLLTYLSFLLRLTYKYAVCHLVTDGRFLLSFHKLSISKFYAFNFKEKKSC